ncbi:Variable outer membrane protein [Borrelia duttonii CR2A]|uniref:Variable outer membrane protein n=1 Tax=Borrelia duttonii CR2A TaxID=1432657 RepID=W6TFZ5_9SPIR|nr:Variable outer membrane protein [Borrelia duttonii CR2A]
MKATKAKLNEILEQNGHYEKVKEKVDEFITTIDNVEAGAKGASGGG